MNEPVLILGAGGHAKVVCDILRLNGCSILGYLDDDPAREGQYVLGAPVLGAIKIIAQFPSANIAMGIGDNGVRSRLYDFVRSQGRHVVSAIHPTAVIGTDVEYGPGLVMCASTVINVGTCLGANIILNTACSVDHDCRVGDHVHVGPGAHLCGGVVVGSSTLIGVGASVVPGCHIGSGVLVGGGAVVVADLDDDVRVIGVPARAMRMPHH